MKATIIDLRYKMKDVLSALNRKETVTILYHGKIKGTIYPFPSEQKLSVKEHPFFGINKDSKKTVSEEIESLRSVRYNDI